MSYYSERKLLLGHCWKHDGYGVMDVEMGNISVSYIKNAKRPKNWEESSKENVLEVVAWQNKSENS